jgi:lysophospholipase L1-like esterase
MNQFLNFNNLLKEKMITKKILFAISVLFVSFSVLHLKAQSVSTSTTNIYELSDEPVIDGVADDEWAQFPELPIQYMDGAPAVVYTPTATFGGATFKAGWKGQKLFFIFNVTDANIVYDAAAAQKFYQDYVAVYFNLNDTHLTDPAPFNSSQPQWYFLTNLNPAPEPMNMAGHGGPGNSTATGWGWPQDQTQFPAGKELAWAPTTDGKGYIVEIMLDFSDMAWLYTGIFADGVSIGFDAEVNSVDVLSTDGAGRSQIFWSNSGIEAAGSYQDVTGFGTGILKAGPPIEGTPGAVVSVTINPIVAYLGVDSSTQLSATIYPSNATNKSINWSSSDDLVATVDQTGKVTAVGSGSATITATTVDQGKTSICNVTVGIFDVTSVSVNPTSLSLGIGSDTQLSATVFPTYAANKDINWSSSNDLVATVDQTGKVTGVSTGSVTITATTVDQGKTATCIIDVLKLIRILPFGESTTEGGSLYSYRKALETLLKTNSVSFSYIGSITGPATGWANNIHQGMTGSPCKDLSAWIKANSKVYKADLILLWEGTNNCGWDWQYSPGAPIDQLSKLIDDICANQPQAELFVSTIPPMAASAYVTATFPSGSANANATTYNAAMPALIETKIAQGKKVHFVDTRGVILLTDLTDGIHPSQSGYNKMAPYWFNAIKPYLGLNTGIESSTKRIKDSVNIYSKDNQIVADLSMFSGSFDISIYDMQGKNLLSKKIEGGKTETINSRLYPGIYIVRINNSEIQQSAKVVVR